MRADRLLSLLLLLQTRGRLTARQLAADLEVSERTIYRDIDALSEAGVPVYGDRGPEGGYSLLDGYRTSLTGLTSDQMRAFFMLSIPAPLADLGVSQTLRDALLKLSAALPAGSHSDEEWVRQRFYLDATGWQTQDEPVPHLQTVYQAVWHDRRLRLFYHMLQGIAVEQDVDPYGLVAKAGVWYMVCSHNGRQRVHRVSHMDDVQLRDESFQRPPGFNLAAAWQSWRAHVAEGQVSYVVKVRVSPDFAPTLPRFFGRGIRAKIAQAGPPDDNGWITLDLAFESFYDARGRILGFGRGVEVVEPLPLRQSIIDFASQTLALYGQRLVSAA